MCLDSGFKVCNPPKEEEQEGWKIFDLVEGRFLRFPYYGIIGCYEENFDVPIGEWIKAEGKEIKVDWESYPAGFHIYLEKPKPKLKGLYSALRGWLVVKVKFRNVVAQGWQSGEAVIVAKEMLVPEVEKEG